MTTRRPWYPMNVPDYRADTEHLTPLEHGAYFLLMNEYWLKGCLPIDDKRLRIITKTSPQEWSKIKVPISSFFSQPGWRHKRIDRELAKSDKVSAIKRTSAEVRWGEKSGNGDASAHANGYAYAYTRAGVLTKGLLDPLDPTLPNLLPDSENRAASKPIKKRHEYPDDFEAFWKAYPTDANMPKPVALKHWKKLDEEDRVAAVAAIPAFKDYCAKTKDYRPVYADKFLSERRFDGHLRTATKVAAHAGVFVRRDTPQWDAWVLFWQATGKGREPPSRNGGWHFPTAYPPNRQQ